MSRMKPTDGCRLTARVSKTLKEEFKEVCQEQEISMTEAIENYMEETVNNSASVSTGDDVYLPDDSELSELYQTCLDVATHGDKGPTIYQKRHASTIAQRCQQTTAKDLNAALMPLRKAGFVSEGVMPAMAQGDVAARWRHWIIKPPCADPTKWKYREGNND